MNLQSALNAKIEELRGRIDALEGDAKPIREQLGNIDRTKAKLRTELTDAQEKIKELSAKPRVSDHAVIRFLERKHGFTFEDVRAELLTDAVIAAMRAGAEGVKTPHGKLKLKGMTVVTFID